MASTRNARVLTLIALIIPLLVASVVPMSARAQEDRVEVVARQFEFDPGRIVAVAGEPLVLAFRTEDVTHGIFIDGQGVDVVVEPGQEVVVNIVPSSGGKFKIRCSVTCGPLHPFMVGELVVEQRGINPLFIGSLASLLAVGILSTAYVLRRHPSGTRGGEE